MVAPSPTNGGRGGSWREATNHRGRPPAWLLGCHSGLDAYKYDISSDPLVGCLELQKNT